ncbi:uncharacterized protein LOC135804700 [Sycon ciliatum]|uniref:uncharacterized protein LOC135804700 n=1 Tax=Sycon ciliatum TaxID=27933 RepID=UPI0020ADB517|eukprot:scpid97808/ scgid19330/ 
MPIFGILPRRVKFFPVFRPHEQIERLKGGKQRPHPVVRRIDHSKVAEAYPERKKMDVRIRLAAIRRQHRATAMFDPNCHLTLPEDREIRLLRDGRTIFCWHPESNIPFEFSRPLVDDDPEWKDFRESVTAEEATIMQKLRTAEPSKFTENALVRIFEVKPYVIQQLAPPPAQYVEDMRRRKEAIMLLKESERKIQEKILEKETQEAEDVGYREGVALLQEKGLKQ